MHVFDPKGEPAFLEGRECFDADWEITDNPYPDTSIDYELWRSGWLAASDEFARKRTP